MSAMKRLFQLMAEKKASDIFLSVGSPINIKINGVAMPVNQTDAERRRRPDAALRGAQREADQGIRGRDGAEHRLRAGGRRQRSASAPSARRARPRWWCATSPATCPTFDTLGLPDVLKEIIMEKRGLILMVGATGSGKSTSLAAMLDLRNEQKSGHILTLEDPVEFIFKNKKSHRQPARSRHRHQELRDRAEERAAPGARLHPDRRDPRQADHGHGARLRAVRPPVRSPRCTPTTATTR